MKTFKFLMLAGSLLVAAFAIQSCSEAYQEDFLDSHLECADYCENTQFADLFQNDGDCMSLCTTCNNPSDSAGSSAVCICNWYENQSDGDWDATPFKNKGQCIKSIKNGESEACNTGDPLADLLCRLESCNPTDLNQLFICLIGGIGS